jgi:hypothetical protein
LLPLFCLIAAKSLKISNMIIQGISTEIASGKSAQLAGDFLFPDVIIGRGG